MGTETFFAATSSLFYAQRYFSFIFIEKIKHKNKWFDKRWRNKNQIRRKETREKTELQRWNCCLPPYASPLSLPGPEFLILKRLEFMLRPIPKNFISNSWFNHGTKHKDRHHVVGTSSKWKLNMVSNITKL